MSLLSTFYPEPVDAAALGLGTANNVTFASIQNTPIGNTTPAAGTFTTLAANNGTLTASAPVLDLAQTWNASGTTFTGLNLALTNTASASASSYFNINLDAAQVFSIRRGESTTAATLITGGGSGLTWTARTRTGGGVGLNFGGVVGVGTSLQFGTGTGTGNGDLILIRDDAANVLAQRNGTNAQTFRIYNTYTDASNYERGFLRWSSNVLEIGTEGAGTGSNTRGMRVNLGGQSATFARSGSGVRLECRDILIGAGIFCATGSFTLQNSAGGDFGALQFGGSTSSFPALKRSSTALQVRLADDSAFAPFSCGTFSHTGNLGFYGTTAIAQPSSTGLGTTGFVSGGGGNFVHANSTFTGGIGTTAYTLSDIVAHLKNLGLIAS